MNENKKNRIGPDLGAFRLVELPVVDVWIQPYCWHQNLRQSGGCVGASYDNSALVLDKCPPEATNWKQRAQDIHMEVRVLYFVFKNPRTRWYARLVAAVSVGYFFSPIQLLPNFIPVIGLADDLFVLLLGAKILRKITPPELLAECRELARLADLRRKKDSAQLRSAGAITT